ncbi:MAG: 3-hydroxyacyl-ACP dehydratase FabZ [Deltaproteobacteria bacterium]|nr:3-hydroxyacyl-ACP dehydratase FabZ [Deltaproteobacteria bacterium]
MTTTRTLDLEEIKRILPHRYPFLLVDRILRLEEGRRIVGLKNVTANEFFFQGHFPHRPIMPGVLIIEALAQTGGILALLSNPERGAHPYVYLMSLDKVRFRRPVVPGDQLILDLESLRPGSKYFKLKGQALVEDKLVAEAEFMAAVSHEEDKG